MFAVISLALGTYVVKPFFPMCEYPDLAVKIVTIVAMREYEDKVWGI